ncbi:tetratricopeptide repeat protein [Massilia sp. NR 4-1]|uniref:tetratricopeptide repeat protein n=1 Tax=Massilia sp. NR 4-1 TaxID=1678028 RepID=UPI0012376D53|nr:tetratricopeptide repeat protein [Massilia sp. NR 4-1]
MLRSLVFLMLCSAWPSVQAANANTELQRDLAAGGRAQQAGQYKQAYALYAKHAGRSPLAQFYVGLMHQNGWGRDADPVLACRWFERAARGGIPKAQDLFGNCLAKGMGGPVDVPAAMAWYQKAADAGHLLSLCTMGERYLQGDGVAQDRTLGLALYQQAAQSGVPAAMLRLAEYYRLGTDPATDLPLARQYYQYAAERGLAEAQYWLGIMLGEGRGGEPDRARALFWLEEAASAGYAPAYFPTALLYAHAPKEAATGALAASDLAKVYVWNAAAKARAGDASQRQAIEALEALVLKHMPETWRPELDGKVAEHLALFPL